MKKPNFFIIGAPKCGTTSLAAWLGQHPQVYFAPVKEPHFFNTDDTFRHVTDVDTYLKLFENAGMEHLAVGEASTWYLFSETAVPKIERFTGGEARYVVCLRNPVDMAYSLHAQILFSGNESVPDFRKAWSLQQERAKGENLPTFSNEKTHLQYYRACALGTLVERLLQAVPPSRVHFVFLDDLLADGPSEFDKLLRFLSLPLLQHSINFDAKNAAHAPRSRLITQLIATAAALRRWLGLSRGLGILTCIRNLNKREAHRAKLDPDFRSELQEVFSAEVTKLEHLLDKDLSHWRAL